MSRLAVPELTALFIAPITALFLVWPVSGVSQLDRLKNAVEDVRSAVEDDQAAAAELSRKQRYELDRIGTTLNNAESRLAAWRNAEREDVARLERRSVQRGRDEAAEELESFRARYPDIAGHEDVEAVEARIAALDQALAGQAQASAEADASARAAGANAQAHAERIVALRDRLGDILDTIHGNSVVHYDNPDAAREGLETIEAAEAAAGEIRPLMQTVAERYGRERGAITEAMDAAGVSVDKANYMVAANAHDLFEFLEQLDGTRSASAQTLVDGVRSRLHDLDDFAANIQQQHLEEALEMIEIAQQIDPNHPELGRLRVAVEDAADEKQAEQMARIESAEWPGHVESFDGPGSIDQLARSVHEYLSNDRDWGRRDVKPQEILGVAVRGPWQVARRDILGQPVQWRLPVLVAVTDEELHPDGIARAYELSMVAMEGAAFGAPKAPPWDGFWVGDSFFLELARLP
jgi:hypothetical protein